MTYKEKVYFYKKYRNDLNSFSKEQPDLFEKFRKEMESYSDPSSVRENYKDWLFDELF